MAQTATGTRKHKWDGESFPILYEGFNLRVYRNPSGEIFVESLGDERACLRIGSHGRDGIQVTAHDGQFTPWAIHGLPAFLVRGHRG